MFQLNDEGIHHADFYIREDITAGPARSAPAHIVKKQRGVIVQILDRFVEARLQRSLRGDKGVLARRAQKSSE